MDYEAEPVVYADTPAKLKAVANPLRSQLLELLHERAATVGELAAAVDRPPSSIAYHVDLLVEAGFLRVVRTRQVRAIQERFFGRTGRTIVYGPSQTAGHPRLQFLTEAAAEASQADASAVRATLRHARIPEARAAEFFDRIGAIAEEFSTAERSGETTFGLVAAIYQTNSPTLPDPPLAPDDTNAIQTDDQNERDTP